MQKFIHPDQINAPFESHFLFLAKNKIVKAIKCNAKRSNVHFEAIYKQRASNKEFVWSGGAAMASE